MGIFWLIELWLLGKMNNQLEQIRRNQLSPAERAQEDVERSRVDKIVRRERLTATVVLLTMLWVAMVFLSCCGPHGL